ncbi:GTP-binding protein [Actinomadura logoneensis]|uniref:GTP-binding protein n=1 Tax=Actinomadura logoneensis TaxID=2293572 RepID=A0A372JHG5_9ACTN|nr:TetM/TetW/TetO/TetS family tetracycline resistance ribosomal protection protein [Actinomadura logoneensis]RFU38808.1 GTP-binding protein [Actinomadura logoneensis]
MTVLNLGVLAHVDAGKTSLTERLLFDAGAIGRLGGVDAGDTHTDTGDLERRRGITIRSAVASFALGGLTVNLVDTPGHTDFTAEVERALGVLDAAVLVLSAVEGVQARTRVLARILRRRAVPTLLFVNKIDRTGARDADLLATVRARLFPGTIALNEVHGAGTRGVRTVAHDLADPVFREAAAEILAEHDDALLADLVDGRVPGPSRVRAALRAQTAAARATPLVFGSALNGQGARDLLDAIAAYLPPARGDASAPVHGTVFALERAAGGEKTAVVRVFDGRLRPRDKVLLRSHDLPERLARVTSFRGTARTAGPGDIVRVRGLAEARVGDVVTAPGGAVTADVREPEFGRPTLETVVRAPDGADASRLRAALLRLAEEDPLIGVAPLSDGTTALRLYGEVQKEVIAATLREAFGVEAAFEESRIVHVERPAGVGEAVEDMDWRRRRPDFWATVGLRVEPGPPGSGVVFRRETELGALPAAFDRAIVETVLLTLREGLRGWPVTDCAVTLTASGFAGPVSTAADFRGLTPIVLMRALDQAGTRVHEPYHRFELEIPEDALSAVTSRLAALGADVRDAKPDSGGWRIEGELPARRVAAFERELPGLTGGDGVWWPRPSGDRPVAGRPPTRPRTGPDPLDRDAYLRGL